MSACEKSELSKDGNSLGVVNNSGALRRKARYDEVPAHGDNRAARLKTACKLTYTELGWSQSSGCAANEGGGNAAGL